MNEVAVEVTRNGLVESIHTAAVAITDPNGEVLASWGDPHLLTYPRSTLKPFQAAASIAAITANGGTLNQRQLAISCSSHDGDDHQQVEAAGLLAEAGVDESALGCPPAWPTDVQVRNQVNEKTTLSHCCSGKHAAMIWAQISFGEPYSRYRSPDSAIQLRVKDRIELDCGTTPQGPGIDGCGAPAWQLPVSGLARGFARLMAGADGLDVFRDAMMAYPLLIGGATAPDSRMMLCNDAAEVSQRLIAKRGADGVMAVAFDHPTIGPLGIAVKILDGSDRAAGPLAAAIVHGLGGVVPTDILRTPVLGGGEPQGTIEATAHAVGQLVSFAQP